MATYKENKIKEETKAGPDELRGKPSLSMIGLLVMELIIGYEWFVSGLTKVARGDFTSGLTDELVEKSAGAPGWYASFLNGVIIPNGPIFGYMIEIAEILIGLAFIAGPLIWLFAWAQISDRVRRSILFFTAAAAIGGIFMALNFHFANGYSHPWFMPEDSFDEGVDFDSLLVAVNFVIAVVNILLFGRLLRRINDRVVAT